MRPPDESPLSPANQLRALAALFGCNALVPLALLLARALPFAVGATGVLVYFALALRLERRAAPLAEPPAPDPGP